jgi:hypothetical protein
VFANALVVEMEKPRNHCLVEKVVMYWTVAKDMIHWNILQIDWDGNII